MNQSKSDEDEVNTVYFVYLIGGLPRSDGLCLWLV